MSENQAVINELQSLLYKHSVQIPHKFYFIYSKD